jgi:DNA-binding transcriptional ArsR family regulator
MQPVDVLADPAVAGVALDPVRNRLLAALAEPASAATLAARVGMPRQKVNYHVRALEAHGLVRLVEERRHGGLTERILRASASAYVVSPAAMGEVAPDLGRSGDRLSVAYLVALAARVVREVGDLLPRAARAGKRLPTLALDADIRFASARARAQFTDELATAVRELAAKYNDESADGGRTYRLVVGAYPRPAEEAEAPPALTKEKR